MTGYGAAEGDVAGRRARVEIRTVNHRWFNLALRVPAELAAIEPELRDALRRHFERGHVNVQVRWIDEPAGAASIDIERAAGVVAALRELQQRFGLDGAVTVDLVARQADIFALRRGDEGPVVGWETLAPVLARAAADCRVARRREGGVLGLGVAARLQELERAAARIAA